MAAKMGAGAPARGRGRPKGSTNKPKAAEGGEKAPGLGHNAPDEGVFFAWLQRLNAQDAKVELAKAALKIERDKRKDLRQEAGGAGLVMGELDDALADMRTEKVDLEQKEERRRLYRQWLGLPVGGQQEAKVHVSDPAYQKNLWVKKAKAAGSLGEDFDWAAVPGDLMQDAQAAYTEGQMIVAKASKLLGPAFAGEDRPVLSPEEVKAAKQRAEQESERLASQAKTFSQVLVLDGSAFPGVADIDDANLKSLAEDKREAWAHAETVMVIMDSKKRILKEPAQGDGEAYEDTGEDGVELTEVGDVAPEDLQALQGDEAPADAPGAEPAAEPVETQGVEGVEGGDEAPTEPEPDWAKLDDDPENWFAADKAAARAWIMANPDAILKHPGAIALAQAMAAAERADGASDGAGGSAEFE